MQVDHDLMRRGAQSGPRLRAGSLSVCMSRVEQAPRGVLVGARVQDSNEGSVVVWTS